MFVSNCIPEGHAVFVGVDGAVLQYYLVHAFQGGGGLCLMRLCVPGPLLRYKNTTTSRLARGDDVRRCRALYTWKLIRMPPGPVYRRGRLKQRGAARWAPFLARSRFRVARGVWGVEEVKRRGGAHHSSGPVLFPIFLTALLDSVFLNARPGVGWNVS